VEDEFDWTKLTEEDLKSHAPALYEAIRASAQEGEGEVDGDAGGSGQPKITDGMSKEAVEQIVATALEAQAVKARKIASAERQTKALVESAGIPPRSQAQILARFDGSEEFVEATVQEAIADKKAELAEYKAPQMRGLGTSTGTAQEGQLAAGVPVPSAHARVMAGFGIKTQTAKSGEGAAK
jgi:hypothetical protein